VSLQFISEEGPTNKLLEGCSSNYEQTVCNVASLYPVLHHRFDVFIVVNDLPFNCFCDCLSPTLYVNSFCLLCHALSTYRYWL